MISISLALALTFPPSPPGLRIPSPSPKAAEFQTSLGTPMAKAVTKASVSLGGFTITNISLGTGTITIQWQEGVPPFLIEGKPSLDGQWSSIAIPPTTARSATFDPDFTRFFRVQGNVVLPLEATHTNPNTLTWEAPTIDMSDSLTPFLMDRTAQQNPSIDPTNNTGWDNVPYASSNVIAPWTDPGSPAGEFTYRVRQTTVGNVVIPYSLKKISATVGSGALVWEKEFTGETGGNDLRGTAVVVDPTDNSVIVAIIFKGANCMVGGTTLPTMQQGICLARFTSAGLPVWVKAFGAQTQTQLTALSLSLDSLGNIILTGDFTATVDFGGSSTPITSLGWTIQNNARDCFVAKFNSSGICQWAQRFGADALDDGQCVASPDASGNLFVSFFSRGSVDFGGGHVFPQIGTIDLVFVKISGVNGSYINAKRFGFAGYQAFARSIKVSALGSVTLGGQFNNDSGGPLDFGNSVTLQTGFGAQDGFIVRFNSSMVAQWAVRFGSSGINSAANDIAVDGSDNVVATGNSGRTMTFSGTGISLALSPDATQEYFVKYNANGSFAWATVLDEVSVITCSGLGASFDTSGNPLFSGFIQSIANKAAGSGGVFPNGYWNSQAAGHCFWVRCNTATGAFINGGFYSTAAGETRGSAITRDSQNNVLVTGYIKGPGNPVDFGPDIQGNASHVVTSSNATYDGFLAKFTP